MRIQGKLLVLRRVGKVTALHRCGAPRSQAPCARWGQADSPYPEAQTSERPHSLGEPRGPPLSRPALPWGRSLEPRENGGGNGPVWDGACGATPASAGVWGPQTTAERDPDPFPGPHRTEGAPGPVGGHWLSREQEGAARLCGCGAGPGAGPLKDRSIFKLSEVHEGQAPPSGWEGGTGRRGEAPLLRPRPWGHWPHPSA